MNMLDYLDWRGDLSFDSDSFNEIDNIILSRLAYFPLKEDDNLTIQELSLDLKRTYKEDDANLIKRLANSNRFKDAILTNYVNVLDKEKNEQFAAVTIILNEHLMFVSFCGSNDSLISWHENFDMFYKNTISGQLTSISYLTKVLNSFKQDLIVGGHSKGGNLAIFSSSFIDFSLQKRIINIYNNDGPGFNAEIINSKGYQKIIPKIKTFVPQTTIVSTFFDRKEQEVVIHSKNKGIMQHNMYSWEVIGNKFIKDVRDKNSYTIDNIVNEWVKETTKEERKEFTTNLFKIMDATNSDVFRELGVNSIKHVSDISKVYKEIDSNKRKEMFNILRLILAIGTTNFLNNLKERFVKK